MGRIRSPSWFLRLSPPHLPRNSTALGITADSRSMMMAAFGLPMPKLIRVMSSLVTLAIGRSAPWMGAPVSWENVCR